MSDTTQTTTTTDTGVTVNNTTNVRVSSDPPIVPFSWTWLYEAGWRPAIGWACVGAVLIQFWMLPVTQGLCLLFGGHTIFPPLDLAPLMTLAGMALGFGVMRSVDKNNGVS